MGHFKVKAMFFEVAKHFFNPHAHSIKADSCARGEQVGSNEGGFFLPTLMVQEDMGGERAALREKHIAHPHAHAGVKPKAVQATPGLCRTRLNQIVTWLAQRVVPAPKAQVLNQEGMVKFAIAHQRNLHAKGQQSVHIGEQLDLFSSRATAPTAAHPCPSYRQATPMIGYTHHQQTMSSTDFGGVNNQTHLPCACCYSQQCAGNRVIPQAHSHRLVLHKALKAFGNTQLLGPYRYFSCRQAQLHAARQKYPHHQPDHITQSALTVIWNTLHQILVQATIQSRNGHWTHSVFSKWFGLSNSTLLG